MAAKLLSYRHEYSDYYTAVVEGDQGGHYVVGDVLGMPLREHDWIPQRITTCYSCGGLSGGSECEHRAVVAALAFGAPSVTEGR